MKFLIFDLSAKSSSTLEDTLDNKILKELPFSAKYKTNSLEYSGIMVPIREDITEIDTLEQFKLRSHITLDNETSMPEENIERTLYTLFKDILGETFSISITTIVDDSNISVLYTDGSFSKATNRASYACCRLLEEDENGLVDEITGKKFLHEEFSGVIENGTNNIGELTSIEVAIQNINPKKTFNIIVSDSIYGIKTYREYIHVWKNNNYKTYNNKEIKNKELIINTFEALKEIRKGYFVLFKWTKGHANIAFNERCDELAKSALNIKK